MKKPDKIKDRVLYGVDAIIFKVFDDGYEVLMLKREAKGERFKTGWEFIKGALKVDENYLEAALREIKEETNVKVKFIGEIEGIMEVDAKYRQKPHYDYVRKKALVFLYVDGDVKIDKSEHKDYKWMKFEEAIDNVWVEFGKEILIKSREIIGKWRTSNHSFGERL